MKITENTSNRFKAIFDLVVNGGDVWNQRIPEADQALQRVVKALAREDDDEQVILEAHFLPVCEGFELQGFINGFSLATEIAAINADLRRPHNPEGGDIK